MIHEILNRLTNVKRRGNNTWIACCPAHNDKNPSLAIALTHDNRILMKCFAGCESIEIVHSIGLELKDLFPKYGLNPYGVMKRLQYEYRENKEIEHAKIVMAIYESDKANKKKLNRQDRETVLNAYRLLRESNEND